MQTVDEERTPMEIAWHEAGHALMAVLNSLDLAYVTINPQKLPEPDAADGMIELYNQPPIKRAIETLVAGYAAQNIYKCLRRWKGYRQEQLKIPLDPCQDLCIAFHLAEDICGEEEARDYVFKAMKRIERRFAKRYVTVLINLADELFRKGTLTGEECRKFIKTCRAKGKRGW